MAVAFWSCVPRPFIFQNGTMLFGHLSLTSDSHCDRLADKEQECKEEMAVKQTALRVVLPWTGTRDHRGVLDFCSCELLDSLNCMSNCTHLL